MLFPSWRAAPPWIPVLRRAVATRCGLLRGALLCRLCAVRRMTVDEAMGWVRGAGLLRRGRDPFPDQVLAAEVERLRGWLEWIGTDDPEAREALRGKPAPEGNARAGWMNA